ncbi:MAG TPA: right-handed parallel beta-helix repeat-containing protein, partial [Candidatus Goldiibacteriota bacterium]|nr:right-handed parallel beta-helix repeat-containing protein [Candidatus Goldiibacteriota bacterium]
IVINVFYVSMSIIYAETYYVSMTGSNSDTGIIGHPWQTLQYAVNRLSAGDILIVEDGTYTGFYMNSIKGNATQRITITARNRLGVIINQPPEGRTRNVEFLSCSYVTFDGFEVTGAPGAGIAIRTVEYEYTGINCRDDIIQNCHSHHNSVGDPSGSHDGIFTGFALNVTIQYNVCNNNGEHGIYVSNSADNPVVRGNVVYGNYNNGIHMNSDLSSGGDGIINNWLVEENIIYDNGRTGINLDGDSNGMCRNNLLYNNRAGIALYQIDGAQGASNNTVVNNTIYTCLAPTTPNTGSLRAALQVADDCNDNTIFNNIIYAIGPGYTAAFDVGTVMGLQHDYNIVGRFGGSAPHFTGTAASSNEISPTPDVIFNDELNGDFTLISGCRAVDAGINMFNLLSAPLIDILGNPRPQAGGFDIGCYEFVLGSPTNTPTRTQTPILTPTFTVTYSRTFTPTATNTNSPTTSLTFNVQSPTWTTTRTPIYTLTSSVSFSATPTFSPTLTATARLSVTQTWTGTPPSLTRTPTQTWTLTIFISHTNTPVYSPTESSEEKIKIYHYILFPNPVVNDSDIIVRFSSSKIPEEITIEIYTIALRKIYEQTEDNLIGDIIIKREEIKTFARGIYLYRLRIKNKGDEISTPVTPFIILNR